MQTRSSILVPAMPTASARRRRSSQPSNGGAKRQSRSTLPRCMRWVSATERVRAHLWTCWQQMRVFRQRYEFEMPRIPLGARNATVSATLNTTSLRSPLLSDPTGGAWV